MRLTEKDKAFVEKLRDLINELPLSVRLANEPYKRFVLKKNYGSRVETAFGMSRQGVRWRFQRLMDMYVSAYETILFLESTFGTDHRHDAMAVAKERAELRKKQAARR